VPAFNVPPGIHAIPGRAAPADAAGFGAGDALAEGAERSPFGMESSVPPLFPQEPEHEVPAATSTTAATTATRRRRVSLPSRPHPPATLVPSS
jgi:hypothetical protein